LDIVTLNVLEEFLESYQGCLLMVTHDRYFMDKLVDHVFVFTGDGKVRDIHGNYTEYRDLIESEKKEMQQSKENVTTSKVADNKAKDKKLSFNEKRELEQLEKDLALYETQKTELIAAMGNHCLIMNFKSYRKNMKNCCKISTLKTMRWLQLAELAS
jgi:ATP-binding cassette subfamily F protein uup